MFNIAGLFTRQQVKSSATETRVAMKKNLFRLGTAFITILIASVSAFAGNHQICFEIPSLLRPSLDEPGRVAKFQFVLPNE